MIEKKESKLTDEEWHAKKKEMTGPPGTAVARKTFKLASNESREIIIDKKKFEIKPDEEVSISKIKSFVDAIKSFDGIDTAMTEAFKANPSYKNSVKTFIVQRVIDLDDPLIEYIGSTFEADWTRIEKRGKDKAKKSTSRTTTYSSTGKKQTKKEIKISIRDRIGKEFFIKTKRKPKIPYVYKHGVYRNDYMTYVEQKIQEYIEPYDDLDFTERLKKDIELMIKIKTYIEEGELFNKDLNIINFKNGLYHIKENKMMPHTPNYLSTIQIPYKLNYDSLNKDIIITKSLKETLYKKDIPTFYEFGGLCLTTDISFQKALLFYGPTKSKKTTTTNLMNKVVGRDNVSHVGLDELSGDYKKVKLEDVLINSASDIDYGTKIDVNFVKRYIGGDDEIIVREIYEKTKYIKPTAKHIFTCANDFPYLSRYGNLDYYRRWVWLPTPYQVDLKDVDGDILNWNHISDEEIEGLIIKYIIGLKRLKKRGRFEDRFYQPEIFRQIWQLRSHELYKFVKECGTEGIYKTANIDKDNKFWDEQSVILKAFNKWQEMYGMADIGITILNKLFGSHPTYNATKRVIDGVTHKIYTGFTLDKPKGSDKGVPASKVKKKKEKIKSEKIPKLNPDELEF